MPEPKHAEQPPLRCIDVPAWRKYTADEMVKYLDRLKKKTKAAPQSSLLAVRTSLSPVDMYCYLKARFGEPNGVQTFLRTDDSDNWIHWDYLLKIDKQDIYICGTSREIHFLIEENLSDRDWHKLIQNIKSDFGRIGKDKSAVLHSLEKWVIFPNKFVRIANICAEHHAIIIENIGGYKAFQFKPSKTQKDLLAQQKTLEALGARAEKLYKSCVELSLIAPVLAEAFINMVILMYCKQEIRNNQSHFNDFIRAHIHTKIFDLFYKCDGFIKPITPDSEEYRNFKRIMDKRNHEIHGNIDPAGEKIETVYFEGTRPLYQDSGDHIGKAHEALEAQYKPGSVIKDYEDVFTFLYYIGNHLKPEEKPWFWKVMGDSQPGYEVNQKRVGALFPNQVRMGLLQGIRYDDELAPI